MDAHDVILEPAGDQGGLVFACPKCARKTIIWGRQERDPTWWGSDVLHCSYRDCGYDFFGREKAAP